jgi:hypothetical protein
MPREDRRITFENDEVYKAIFALCMQKQLRKPIPGEIVKISEASPEGAIIIEFENGLEQKKAKEEYPRDFIAAALLLYCRGCGIPLAKTAKKSVMLVEGALVLRAQN